jgi:uncharacterized protein with HEPN domain
MSRRNDTVYLRHMQDYARDALAMIEGRSRADVETDRTLRYALLHVTCIMGEAAGRVSVDTRSVWPQIPWRPIIGMRNRLIHGYDIVDMDVLWSTVVDDFPPLLASLEEVLRKTTFE